MTPQQQIDAIVESLEPAIRRAFLEAIEDIRSEAQLRVIIGHLEAGNVDLALQALNLRAELFGPLDNAITQAYYQGGMEALSLLPAIASPFGGRAVLRFSLGNERAESYIRNHSSALIQEIAEDTRQGVRAALTEGMEAGQNPRTVALSIVGRMNRETGRREGGLVGLHSVQMKWVSNFKSKLAEGDREYLQDILSQEAGKPKAHRSIKALARKALKEDRGLTRDEIAKAERIYTNRLLKYRGDVIGRTEALSAFNAAQHEAIQQQIDNGTLSAQDVTKVWLATSDGRTRDSHVGLNDTEVRWDQSFRSPVSGTQMRFPTDTSLGAPASETIQCRCAVVHRISFAKQLARRVASQPLQ